MSSLENCFLFAGLYYILGYLYIPGSVAPNFYPLTPLAWFGIGGLPFFSSIISPWLYFFFFQSLTAFFYRKRMYLLILFFYSCFFTFFHKKESTYYWLKEKNMDWKFYFYNDYVIFPENMFFIENETILTELKRFGMRHNKKIIAGISWQAIVENEIRTINGVFFVDQKGKTYIREKSHQLRFVETKNKDYKLSGDTGNLPETVYICSEFFLTAPKRYYKDYIVIASVMWTKSIFTFLYKNMMIIIYDLKRLYC